LRWLRGTISTHEQLFCCVRWLGTISEVTTFSFVSAGPAEVLL
jgi:hypothetical protein